jgi:hypothetical protein
MVVVSDTYGTKFQLLECKINEVNKKEVNMRREKAIRWPRKPPPSAKSVGSLLCLQTYAIGRYPEPLPVKRN